MAKGGGRFSRLARLGSLTSRVSGSYLGERVKSVFRDSRTSQKVMDKLHIENAEKVADALSRMKGAAMKLGQSMAVAAGTLDLPEDVRRVLGKLNHEAEPIPFSEIRATVERELEGALSERFLSFSQEPLGTASLAQAHAATLLDGTDVVVKVLHDGVDVSVETDLMALKAILVGGRVLRRPKAEIDAIFEEIQDRLVEELDYYQEAANLQQFHDLYGDDPRVRIPRIYTEYCTDRVLTMDRLPGQHLEAFLQTATPQARQRAGLTLAELYYEMAFKHRMLHADPHPGNYLFEPDGRVGLLDFGCVKRFDEFWIARYAAAALAALDGDRDAMLAACRDIGGWTGDSPQAADVLWDFAETLGAPYRAGLYTISHRHEESTADKLTPIVRTIMGYPEITAPKDMIFLHRSLGGLYSIARQLEVTADYGAILRDATTHAIAVASGSR